MRAREASALLAAAGALLCCAAQEPGPPTPPPPLALIVSAVAFSERAGADAALTELLRAALQAGAGGGVEVRKAPPPPECTGGRAPDAPLCLRAALAALAAGELHAVVVPAGAGALPPAPRLREAGLESWGALARQGGGPRRTCYATGALRSLSELAAAPRAEPYRAPPPLVLQLAPTPRYFCSAEEGGSAACAVEGSATALVGPAAEARALLALAAQHSLRLHVVALGAGWEPARALARLATAGPVLLCGRALDAVALAERGAHALGPPPCDLPDCPFDARPLQKLSAAGALARSPAARAAFDRLALDEAGVRSLEARAAALGAAVAARAALREAGDTDGVRGAEVRVAVLVPLSTARDAGSAHALRAAAELAEEDEAAAGGDPPAPLRFKVELVDSGCAEARTLKYLTDALGSEFHALSAAFGGTCALALEGVARQSGALDLPAVSVAWRRRRAAGMLLAAGDGAAGEGALAALLAALGWRRVALLSEAGALPAGAAAQALDAELAVTAELEAGEDSPAAAAEEWASLAAARGARILLLACEDARAARAALCACERAGLTPERGAVFVVVGPLGARGGRWVAEGEACARRQAEGALLLSPEWAARWREAGAESPWAARWRARARPVPDEPPPAAAALLYDALRLWAAAVRRLARSAPETLDDLHRPDRVTALISEVVGGGGAPYAGVTGAWEWKGGARGGAAGAVRVSQWSGGRERRAGVWRGGGGGLALEAGALRWRTAGGRVPDDGAEGCLWGLPCRWAGWVGGGAGLAAAGALLAGGAWHCRRRAARDHRARLAAFGMRALPDKAGAPDRWELPRERVVINRKLGSGAFGAVYGGHALLAAGGGESAGGGGRAWAAVAVKTLKPGASTEQKLDFLSEAEVMKRFRHARVVRLLGVVTRSEPVCTVMELMLYGDLKGYLVARRHLAGAAGAAGEEAAPARLTRMARDAALGLAYLARMRYVHRDVAARNCLVDAARRVKLADFGMTRIVFDKEYYRFGRKGMLPVRWMAPESLAHGVFSPASDVWSFGVLLYEMVTFGALPYRGLPNHEALERAKAGCPPPLPPALDPQLEALIRSCWRVERRARPAAAALAGFLAEWPRLLTPCPAPPDALDEPLPLAPAHPAQVGWAGWAALTSAGTDTTYLSAEPAGAVAGEGEGAPRDTDPFLPLTP